MLLIALTGGIGAGKSSAGSLLARLGAVHVSADQLAREILERGEVGFDEVVAHFGDQILTAGAIDRNKLASLVFQDPKKREDLEEITHPLIHARFTEMLRRLPEQSVVVYEIPLLAENIERVDAFDVVLTIESTEEIRMERLQQRGYSREHAQMRMGAQVSDAQRREIAHQVIENNGDKDSLLRALEHWWATFVLPKLAN